MNVFTLDDAHVVPAVPGIILVLIEVASVPAVPGTFVLIPPSVPAVVGMERTPV